MKPGSIFAIRRSRACGVRHRRRLPYVSVGFSMQEKNFRRAERKLLRAEMTQLIESFVEAGWIDADERPFLLETMEQRLQQSRPRRRYFWKFLR